MRMSSPPNAVGGRVDQRRQLRAVEQVRLRLAAGSCALRIELLRQRRGILGGAAVVEHDVGAGRVQRARDRGADTARAAGDEYGLARRAAAVLPVIGRGIVRHGARL